MLKTNGKRARAIALPVLLSMLLFLLLISSVAFAETAETVMYGDVNNDGKIDVRDVVLVMRHALALELLDAEQQILADVNGDGRVNVSDVTLIMQRALGLIDRFPLYNVESVRSRSKTVEFATYLRDIDFPETVEATLSNGTVADIEVLWDSESTPAYDRLVPGDYVFRGTLVNLPGSVKNPAGVRARCTVTVVDAELEFAYVSSEMDLKDAMNQQADVIILESNVTLTEKQRIRYDLYRFDLNGYRLILGGGPIVFEGDGTVVLNGTIAGEITTAPPDEGADGNWDGTNGWQLDNAVLVDGEFVEFREVDIRANFADWYQQQASPASFLILTDCNLFGLTLFTSDVAVIDSSLYNRTGIEHDDALLSNVALRVGSGGSVGILYVAADATLNDISWIGNFTGMFVGKSLKYYNSGVDELKYVPAEPTLTNARIINDKYGLAWWALNHYKAHLHTAGLVESDSDGGGPGLMLVGTDYRDYDNSTDPWEYEGGYIHGTATFSGSSVWFGRPTSDYLENPYKKYNGEWTAETEHSKSPVRLTGVDEQANWKNADRLTIHGPTFNADVYIFTPSNRYIGCTVLGDGGDAPLEHSVWLGNVTLTKAYLWGDFTIVDRKTVTVVDELEVNCGNIRGIFTKAPDLSVAGECPTAFASFERYGTLQGGRIISDTKRNNVLVLGDGLLVNNVLLHRFLYNVILETVRLQDVTINMGDSSINQNDDRIVCGLPLPYDVHVWPGHHATFSGVTWSLPTRVGALNSGRLSLEGTINNYGTTHLQTNAFINLDSNAVLQQDIRTGHEVWIEQGAERIWIKANYASKLRWLFNGWKFDYLLTTTDDRIESTIYEFYLPATGERFLVDLRDLARPDLDFTAGVWLTDVIEEIPVTKWPLNGAFPAPGGTFEVRITAQNDKTFNLKVEAWARNCCNQRQIFLGSDQKEVTLKGKVIQEVNFEVEFDDDGFDPLVEVDSENNVVQFTVTNTGTVRGTQEVRLAVNGSHADESGDITLNPGQSTTGSLTYTAPSTHGPFTLMLFSDDDAATETPTAGYLLTVESADDTQGTTDPDGESIRLPETEVSVIADPAEEFLFVNWTADPAVVTFANPNSHTTTFTMPAESVTVTANFEAVAEGEGEGEGEGNGD